MQKSTNLHMTAIVLGAWFLLTGWMWTYLACLLISYPVGVLSLFLWFRAKKIDPSHRLTMVTPVILGAGLFVSLVAIFLYK